MYTTSLVFSDKIIHQTIWWREKATSSHQIVFTNRGVTGVCVCVQLKMEDKDSSDVTSE